MSVDSGNIGPGYRIGPVDQRSQADRQLGRIPVINAAVAQIHRLPATVEHLDLAELRFERLGEPDGHLLGRLL